MCNEALAALWFREGQEREHQSSTPFRSEGGVGQWDSRASKKMKEGKTPNVVASCSDCAEWSLSSLTMETHGTQRMVMVPTDVDSLLDL